MQNFLKVPLVLFALATGFFVPPAKAEEIFSFQKIVSTIDRDVENRFVEISSPIFREGKHYFKTISLGKKDKPFFSIFSYTPEEGLTKIIDSSAKLPGTDRNMAILYDFDVRDGKVVLIADADRSETLGIYIVENDEITRIVGGPEKMPTRPLFFKQLNEVMFFGNGIVYTGGREMREGLYYYENGESTLLMHKPIAAWARRKGLTHKTVQSFSTINRVGDQLVLSVEQGRGENIRLEFYTLDQQVQLTPWKPEEAEAGLFEKITFVGGITGTEERQVLLGFDEIGFGTLYSLSQGRLEIIANNSTALWPESPYPEVVPAQGTPFTAGEVLLPSHEMYFRKSNNTFPFWRNVYSVYEMEGMIPQSYIGYFFVFDEKVPLSQPYNSENWTLVLLAALAKESASAGSGGAFIKEYDSAFGRMSRRSAVQGYASHLFDWSTYFQVPLTAGNGGYAASGDSVVFHGVNLYGHQGLFLHEGGEIKKILQKGDRLFGQPVKNLYIGHEGYEGDDILFWVEFEMGSPDNIVQALVKGKRRKNTD